MSFEKYTYNICENSIGGVIRYFALFTDGNGISQETEIPYEVYLALDQCRLDEKRQQNYFDRHIEHLTLSDNEMNERLLQTPNPMEDSVALASDVQKALVVLTETQRRRFLLHYEMGYSYEQIAKAENLSKQAIAQSVGKAEERIKKYFSEGG